MSNDADEIVVGANGKVWVGPLTATLPTNPTSNPTGFTDLGYMNEDGLKVTDSKTLQSINVWQSFYAARRIVTDREFMVAFVARQWNPATIKLAFGGGTITEPTTDVFKYSPPDPADVDERAMVLDWQDGDKNYRVVIPRGMVTENVESQITRSSAADLPITFSVNGVEGQDPWNLYTDDPAFG